MFLNTKQQWMMFKKSIMVCITNFKILFTEELGGETENYQWKNEIFNLP
jgi:hypothetical protein